MGWQLNWQVSKQKYDENSPQMLHYVGGTPLLFVE
jgi:hypothetical protein